MTQTMTDPKKAGGVGDAVEGRVDRAFGRPGPRSRLPLSPDELRKLDTFGGLATTWPWG